MLKLENKMAWTILPGWLGTASIAMQVKNEYNKSKQPVTALAPAAAAPATTSLWGGIRTRRIKRKARKTLKARRH